MGIITYAQDIMYLAIALGVLLIASGIAWLLFLMVMVMRDIRSVITSAKETIKATHDTIAAVKQKVGDVSVQFKFLLEGMKSVLSWIDRRRNTHEDPNQKLKQDEKSTKD